MENRRKFYPDGLWGKDTLQERYLHVMGALDAYHKHILDEQDLVFVIKNAFVSKIYISEGVANAYSATKQDIDFGDLSSLYDKLLTKHVLDLQDNPPVLNTEYMRSCELGTRVSYLKDQKKLSKDLPSIRVEHVVPADVFMKDVKVIQSFQDFKDIFDVVSICLVTNDEAKLLDKGLRNSMPAGANYIQNYVSNNYCFNYQNFRKSPIQNR